MQNSKRWIVVLLALIAWAGGAVVIASAAQQTTTTSAPAVESAHDGWVHITVEKVEPDADDAHDEEIEAHDESDILPPELYIHKTQEVLCTIMDFGDRKIVRLLCPKTARMAEYDSRYNGIALGTMPPELIARARADISRYPLTLEGNLAQLEEGGSAIQGTNEVLEEGLRKVTIVYIGGRSCGGDKVAADKPATDTIWLDPKTGLVRRLRPHSDHPQLFTFTYDHKPRKDICDFGVPRDAQRLDSLPTPKASAMLDRFDKHNDDGFGDFVGVLTETDVQKDGKTKKMFLHLYAQHDQKLLFAIFDFTDAYADSPMQKLANWPKVDIKQVLEFARKTIPLTYYVTDGTAAWTGRFDGSKENKSCMLEGTLPLKDLPPNHDYFAVNEFWRNRVSLFLYGYGPRADTVADAAHEGLSGLRLREGNFAADATNVTREERIFWVDPKRNDLPIHYVHRGERVGTKLDSRTEFNTRFLDFAQLPSGTWYPTHWQTVATRDELTSGTKGSFTREKYLVIDTAVKIDASWYTSWAKRLGIEARPLVLKDSKTR